MTPTRNIGPKPKRDADLLQLGYGHLQRLFQDLLRLLLHHCVNLE